MNDENLQEIQSLQFVDKSRAEALLLNFISGTFPKLDVKSVTLRPQAVSLNSFNGFLTCANGDELFFKTHVEQDNVIGEYYNAQMMDEAGYPIVKPIHSSTSYGQQILIYEVVNDPSVFDVARQLERDFDPSLFMPLKTAQESADDFLFSRYHATLDTISADEASHQPIHQLFYHRLTGGRLDNFYGSDRQISLPHGTFTFETIRDVEWTINGSQYSDTLNDIIERSITLLQPHHDTATIIGHGDAHNGNVFFNVENGLTYFDPAFAGRHHPLLDLTKPLFHNVFAMWLYFPDEESDALGINVEANAGKWIVNHDYTLNEIRRMFIDSKVTRCLIPTLKLLKQKNALETDWRAFLKSALFCCPFLTLNLTKFPPPIALLGLTMAVQMGAESSDHRSTIDKILDDVESLI